MGKPAFYRRAFSWYIVGMENTSCPCAKFKEWTRKYAFYLLAPLGLLVLTLVVLYIIYGPKMFVAFLYAGI